ncbi:unnamed protein product [Calypogeia fissa]
MLPENFGNHNALKRLFTEAKFLGALPNSFGNLAALEILIVSNCTSLKRLPASFGNLSSLERLEVKICTKLQRLPENFGKPKALKVFKLIRNHRLQALPDSIGNLSSLKEIHIDADGLKTLPGSLGQLQSLEELHISASKLQSLLESLGQLCSLRKLEICCSNLGSVPEELGNLSCLEVLSFVNCCKIKSLPDSLRHISSLMTIALSACDELSIPDGLGNDFGINEGCCSPLRKTIPLFGSELECTPASLGNEFMCHADRNVQTKRTAEGGRGFSHIPSAKGIWLYVGHCQFLDDLAMRRLGWIEPDRDESRNIRVHTDFISSAVLKAWSGKWYRRKRPGEGSPSVPLS